MVATKLVTIEDVERMPDDEFRYTLLDGVLYRMPLPQRKHARIVSRVDRVVGVYVDDNALGELLSESGYALKRDPDTLLGPDLSFVRAGRLLPEHEDRYPDLAPDLAIEVRSPSEYGPSMAEKVRAYLDAGTRMVWFFDPKRRTVTVHRLGAEPVVLTETDHLDGGDVLPGFRVPVARFFA